MEKFLKKLRGPEDITNKIYSCFTSLRVSLFYILFVFVLISAIFPNLKLPSLSPEFFADALKAIINVLLAIGAIIATFVAIALEIVKKQEKAKDVTNLWSKFAKYIIYPFTIAIFAGAVLFLEKVGVNISKTNLSFSVLVLFGYLTVNSIYIIVRAAEDIVNENWRIKKSATNNRKDD